MITAEITQVLPAYHQCTTLKARSLAELGDGLVTAAGATPGLQLQGLNPGTSY